MLKGMMAGVLVVVVLLTSRKNGATGKHGKREREQKRKRKRKRKIGKGRERSIELATDYSVLEHCVVASSLSVEDKLMATLFSG